jgi:hypothetical protein
LTKTNRETDRLLEHNHNWNGSYRKSYYVSGWDFHMAKRYETKKYCTECNLSWNNFQYLGKANAVEEYEKEVADYQRMFDRGFKVRHSKDMIKIHNRSAARARLITDCNIVKRQGWYKKPISD